MPEEAAAPIVEDLFAEEVGGAITADTAGSVAGAAAVDAAAPGSISMGLSDAEVAGSPFAPAAAGAAGGAAAGAATGGTPTPPAPPQPRSFGLDTLKTAATILAPVASIAGAATGIAAARSIPRAGSVLNTPAPAVTPPVTMPTFGSGTSLTNPFSTPVVQRTAIQQQTQRRGRAATILTDPADSERLGA